MVGSGGTRRPRRHITAVVAAAIGVGALAPAALVQAQDDGAPPTTEATPTTEGTPTTEATPSTEPVAPPTTESTPPTTTTTAPATTTTSPTTTTTPPTTTTTTAPQQPTQAAAPSCRVTYTLRIGATGGDARCVERALVAAGYGRTSVDGVLGADDRQWVHAVQRQAGWPESDIVGTAVLKRLGIFGRPAQPTCSTTWALRIGATGNPARCVELALASRGYNADIDRRLDAHDFVHVRSHQAALGWPTTNVVGTGQLKRLGIFLTPPQPTCTVTPTVFPGATGPSSACVELALASRGYNVDVDRAIDGHDLVHIRRYQAARGWPQTGVVGTAMLKRLGIFGQPGQPTCRATWALRIGATGGAARCVELALASRGYNANIDWRLDSVDARQVRAFQSDAGWSTSSTIGTAMLKRLGIFARPPAPTCRIYGQFRAGATGDSALCIELALAARGYDADIDRSLSVADTMMLRLFQTDQGLTVDGVAGTQTLGRLGILDPNPYGVPANSGTGRRVVYSRAQQRVWAIEADGTVVKTHLISGRLYEPYAGTYHVYSRSMYTYSASNPDIKWRYMVRFAYGPGGGRIGFHEIPTKFGVPLQSESQLGQPLSGGCVRQRTSDAVWMWNWAYLGTKVVVL